jgi:hypothetical protein
MSLGDQRPLACPSCGGPSDLASWLDRAAGATPGGRCVEARCPRCEAPAWLELAADEAAVGTRVPGHPPLFRPAQRARQQGLAVEASLDGLVVRWLHRRWVVPAAPRRGARPLERS